MRIPGYESCKDFVPITRGWSVDSKYRMTMPDGTRYLLRMSPAHRYEQLAPLHGLMEQLAATGLPMCRPVAFGRCQEGVYSVQSWIEGQDLGDVLPTLQENRQEALGYQAGTLLRIIHSLEAPADYETWHTRFCRKMDTKIAQYEASGTKLQGAEHLLQYMQDNRLLLRDRPQSFQHGDYHVGNMMLGNDRLYIIDFDRFDYGDPWEEFNRIVWCAQASPPLASAMVDGYFDGTPPPAFWKLLALYIASNTLSALTWAIPFGQAQLDVMENQARDVLAWYDNMGRTVPTWYKGR